MIFHRLAARWLGACSAAVLLLAPSFADRVVTKDGRVLTCKKARAKDQGYQLVFENGEILLADKSLVQSVEIEGDMSDYVPANDDERTKLAQGYVKYQGKWQSKPAFEELLRKATEKSKARTEEIALHSDWGNAYTKESAHFLIKTNTSPELRDYYAELLEAYYSLMDDRIGIDPTPVMKRTKMTVNVYKSYEEFQKLSDPKAEISPSVLGYFWSYNNTLNFYHDYQEPSRSNWVALHECTHLLTYLIDQQYSPQIWLNEAVADYFGSSRIERDKKGKLVIHPGELQTDRVLTVQQAIKDGASAPPATGAGGNTGTAKSGDKPKFSFGAKRPDTKLEQLFLLGHDEFDGFQYAHAWSFVYFLNNFENGKYQKGFNKFFKGLYTLEKGIEFEAVEAGGKTGTAKKVSPEHIREYLLKRIGIKDTAQLEKDWKTYIANIPIAGPEARLKRALYAVRFLRFDEALEDLDAAIEGGVKDPRAWWARGRARALTGKPDEAVKDLQKAVEMDPLESNFRYELSRLMSGRITLSSRGPGGGITIKEDENEKIDNNDAKLQAGLAMELDPDNDRFREWYARFK